MGWKERLNADPTDWLLDGDDPSVRYLTLVEIAEADPGSAEVLEAQPELGSILVSRTRRDDGAWSAAIAAAAWSASNRAGDRRSWPPCGC